MPHEAIYPPNLAPILASGGLDMSVVLTPAALPAATTRGKVINPLVTSAVATFEDAYQRRIAYPTGNAGSGGVLLARQARLLMALRENGVTLWRIDEKKKHDQEMEIPAVPSETEEDGWARVLEMDLSTTTNLVAGAISDEGRWLAVADLEETKLFSLNIDVRRFWGRCHDCDFRLTFMILEQDDSPTKTNTRVFVRLVNSSTQGPARCIRTRVLSRWFEIGAHHQCARIGCRCRSPGPTEGAARF